MYTVAVMDDDSCQCEALAAMVAQSTVAAFEVSTFTSLDELEACQAHGGRFDICLMDVRVDRADGRFSDGIQAVSSLFPEGSGTQVIYVTGYAEYATPVYETPHVYFLLKPVEAASLNRALAKAVERLEIVAQSYVPVTSGGTIMRLPVAKIVYLESNRRKVSVHLLDGTVETYAKLSDFEEELPPCFMRSHMSFLVNMNFIEWVDSKALGLSTGVRLPVSRQRSAATRDAYHRHLRAR